MFRRFWPLLAVLLVAGCGGSPHHAKTSVTGSTGSTGRTAAAACPPGQSFMGCAAPLQVGTTRALGAAPAGCKFPDVSSYQGHPNWAAVKAWQLAAHCPAGGVFKLGEYVQDPDASYNAGQLHALGMAAVGYWFVRNTGCAHEAAQIRAIADALQITVVALDMEVPEASGYAPCLTADIRGGFGPHIDILIYTGPGTWPGGSSAGLPVWVADYGPSSPPSMFGERPIAWQETDGHFGSPIDFPGIGDVDGSIDYGLLNLAAPKPPGPTPSQIKHLMLVRDSNLRAYRAHRCTLPVLGPYVCRIAAMNVVSAQSQLPGRRPVCWGPHAQVSAPVCQIVRPQVSVWSRARTSSYQAYQRAGCHGPAEPIAKGTPACRKLGQRAGYFNAHAEALFKAWS